MAGLRASFGVPSAWRWFVPVTAAVAGVGVTIVGMPAAADASPPSVAPEGVVAVEAPADEPLTAPDVVSARTIARLEGEPVEVLGERTVTGSVFALPDGTMAAGVASGPAWVPLGGDGTQPADWAPVDLTLQVGTDGLVRPVAHVGGLVISGGTPQGAGAGTQVEVASMTSAEGIVSAIDWVGELPVPTLDGPRATYDEVRPGVDMVVEATTSGFEQFFVVHEAPVGGELALPVIVTSDGAQVAQDPDGELKVTDAAGQVVTTGPEPMMWDAGADADRVHPVTEEWAPVGGTLPRTPPSDLWQDREESAARTAAAAPKSAPSPGTQVPGTQGAQPSPAPEAGELEQLEVERVVTPVDAGLRIDLTPQEDFLADPSTVYPVVVDPQLNLWGGLDTSVQSNNSTDQSSSATMTIGTWDSGATVARSFINFDPLPIRGATILDARLYLLEYYSWSCQARNWEVWATNQASTATRWSSQPTWWGLWSTSSETRGYSGACPGGGVSASVTSLVQQWAASAPGTVFGVGLKAQNEADNFALKRFYTSEVEGQAPWVWVNYNFVPPSPTNLTVAPAGSVAGGVRYINSTTPRLSATVSDPDGGVVTAVFQLLLNGTPYVEKVIENVPSGSSPTWDVPAGLITAGRSYSFIVQARDAASRSEWVTYAPAFQVDTTAPKAPVVASSVFPADGTWASEAGQPGAFTLTPPVADTSLVSYRWALDKAPDPAQTLTASSTGASSTLTVTPPTAGRHVLQVQALDRAGNASAVVKYVFNVGTAGIVAPEDGTRVVNRVRMFVGAKDAMKYVTFETRRGPDSTVVTAVDPKFLTTASGDAWTAPWQQLPRPPKDPDDSGPLEPTEATDQYTNLHLGYLLGYVPGPIQVRAKLSPNADGSSAFATPWVTLTYDPDADGAASTQIGPGAVNLLTGDHSLSVTDAEEFGVSLMRTTSSRGTVSGYQLQAERLSDAQQKATDLSGFVAGSTTLTVATNQFRTGTTSLKVTPSNTTNDTWAAVGGNGGMRLGMLPGHTYRVTGWVYVASGGSTAGANGMALKLAQWNGVGSTFTAASAQANVNRRDTWQRLTFDTTIPANATEAFLRAYSGYPSGGPAVYWDDLSVRELWSPFGPQWSTGTTEAQTGAAYTHITRPYDDVVAVHLTGGGEVWFTSGNGSAWWPEPGAESLKLVATSTTSWRLSELDGTYTDFAKSANTTDFPVITSSPGGATGTQVRHVYDVIEATSTSPGISRLSRVIAPIEPGVDGWPTNLEACNGTTPARGCEVLQLAYTPSATPKPTGTTIGDYPGRVTTASIWSWDPETAAMVLTPVAKYGYDAAGRLAQVHDPRIVAAGDNAQISTYAYDTAGRLTSVAAPGEIPYRYTYGVAGLTKTGAGDWIDPSLGRLLKVSRKSLEPGTVATEGPDNTTTVVYGVPLTTGTGGPYDLGPAALDTWAQTDAPTDGTAIFDPLATEDGIRIGGTRYDLATTATASNPGPAGYTPATVHYLNGNGNEVNTATASPITDADPATPVTYRPEGSIDTIEYDRFGNVVRTLDATNRLLALRKLPDAPAALAALGKSGEPSSAALAQLLDARTRYSADGLDVLETTGPIQRLAVGNDPGNRVTLRPRTTTVYDEGKPDGSAYHLPTTTTSFGLDPATMQQVDPLVTKNEYAPIDGAPNDGPTSGWKHGQPTRVTVDAGQSTELSSTVVYDAQGRAIKSSKPGSTGSDAATTLSVFYTAGTNPDDATCGNRPEWAGQPCLTRAGGAVTGHDPARMGSDLPVKRVEAYNRFGSPTIVTDTAGSGDTLVSRTATTDYDNADRVESVTLTGEGSGVGEAVSTTTTVYDKTTGDVLENRSSTGGVIAKQYDTLGRLIKYTDADGGWTKTTYDRLGQPLNVTDSIGTSRQYWYDRQIDPRGFVTKSDDSVGGIITPTWGPDGQLETQQLPGGVTLSVTYDAARVPKTRTYTNSDGVMIFTDEVVENHRGQWVRHTSDTGVRDYAYDRLGRLTGVNDTSTATKACTSRTYQFDTHTNRTSFATATGEPGTPEAVCPGTAGAAAVVSTYDSADRLVSTSGANGEEWAYDQLGRITAMPTADGTSVATTSYYVNDLVKSQEVPGTERTTWDLDPVQRLVTQNTFAWVNNAWANSTETVNHYDGDSDEPAWIVEDTTLPDRLTRYVEGMDGAVALQTGKTGERVLQVVDLHGDIVGTLPIADGATQVDQESLERASFDEFGVPQPMTGGQTNQAPPRYGWLGAAQRSADTPTGVILMGVRLYNATTGRFLQFDPVAGGSANAYDYCNADPVNCTDLDGRMPKWLNSALKVTAVVGSIASFIPGPIGAAAGAVSAVAYAATGNTRMALMMSAVAAAQLVGAGPAVRVGAGMMSRAVAGGRSAGQIAVRSVPKVGRALASKASAAARTVSASIRSAASKVKAWTGREIKIGNNFRLALGGNRTGHPTGRFPHYHRRIVDPKTGEPVPGGGIGRHRPWDKKSTDKSWRDRF